MRSFYFIFFGIISIISYSQPADFNKISNIGATALENYRKSVEEKGEDIKNDSLYIKTFNHLKKLYEKQQDSESSKKIHLIISDFSKKMNLDKTDNRIDFEQSKLSMIEWVEKNIEKTSFQNIDEAHQKYVKLLQAQNEEIIINEEFYTYMLHSVKLFGGQIFGDVVFDYEISNPNSVRNKFLIENGY